MAVIATAGHVDHGKSSLIVALTGTDPDRLAEEQRKQMTIDLGFANVTTPAGTVLSFIDVPGHGDFIRTMIAGASGVDVAMLVVDAHEGWKPQTQEHLGILEVLAVPRAVPVLTKCDKVDHDARAFVEADIERRLSSSAISWSPIVRTSTRTGEGIADLVESLETLVLADRPDEPTGPTRLFIDRVFSMKGAGVVVTGTLERAPVRVGDELIVARTGATVRVRDIHVHGESVGSCPPRSRCALNLAGVRTDDLERGDALVPEGEWLTTTVFDASITTLSGQKRPVTHIGAHSVHVGTKHQSAKVRVIGADSIAPGSSGLVRVRFPVAMALGPGDRFLLRDTGTNTTIGGGTILDVAPNTRLSRARPDGSVEAIMAGRGFVPVHEARVLTGRPLEAVFGDWYATNEVLDSTRTHLERTLARDGTIDLATLGAPERELLARMDDVVIEAGVARSGRDPGLEEHPIALAIRDGGVTGPDTRGLDRAVVRRLIQAGIVFEHDDIAFHRGTLDALRPVLARLWQTDPDGFTVSRLRGELSITRKHAVPLAECLDKHGLTMRRGDLRVPGRRW